MTEIAELRSKLAEYEEIVPQLVARLRESVDEVDRLKAELARREGASAYDVLVDIMRNSDLPAAIRTKAAAAILPHEKPKLMPERAPLELSANDPDADLPLAELVAKRRARHNAMQGQEIEVSPSGVVRVLPKPGSNGADDSDDDEAFG